MAVYKIGDTAWRCNESGEMEKRLIQGIDEEKYYLLGCSRAYSANELSPEREMQHESVSKYEVGGTVWYYDEFGEIHEREVVEIDDCGCCLKGGSRWWHVDELSPTREACEENGTAQKRKMEQCLVEAQQIYHEHFLVAVDRGRPLNDKQMDRVFNLAIAMFNDMRG